MTEPSAKAAKLLALALDQAGTPEGGTAYERAASIMREHELKTADLPYGPLVRRDGNYDRAVALLERLRSANANRLVSGIMLAVSLGGFGFCAQLGLLGLLIALGYWWSVGGLVFVYGLEVLLVRTAWKWFFETYCEVEQLHINANSLPGASVYEGYQAYRPKDGP